MVSSQLRAVLERGEGVGSYEGADARTGTAEHPICGDVVELSVRVDGDRIRGVRWRAQGCPASMAIAALAAEALGDVAASECERVLQAAVQRHGGLARHERHAEAMVLRALRAALVEA
ncbi:MAG: iron-sulfur cluster assembly scaffold protein [Planctomycetota bacterium]